MAEERADDAFDLAPGVDVDRTEVMNESATVDRTDQLALHVARLVETGQLSRHDLDVEPTVSVVGPPSDEGSIYGTSRTSSISRGC